MFKDNELQLRWDGFMVCSGDWEPRQPQDFVHGVADIQAPKWARPEQSDYFIPVNYTQQPNEQIDVNEALVKAVVKKIGGANFDSKSALNGAILNALALDATVTTTDLERIAIVEAVLIALGRNLSDTVTPTETIAKTITKRLSDSITISESLQLIEVERTVESLSLSESIRFSASHAVAETVSIAESVTKLLVSPTALNGAALNSFRLD
jgi:hypothetical protein